MSTKEQHQGWRWDQLRYRCKTLVQGTIDNIHDKDSSSSVQEWSLMTRCIKEDRNIQHRKGGPWPAQGSKVKMIGQRLSKKYSMKMRHTILLSHNTSDMIQMYWGCPLLSGISEIISEKSLMREKERKGERLPRVKKDEKSYKDLQPGRKTTILNVLCVIGRRFWQRFKSFLIVIFSDTRWHRSIREIHLSFFHVKSMRIFESTPKNGMYEYLY